jgi:DNA-binding transcriptional ArsR family regulator
VYLHQEDEDGYIVQYRTPACQLPRARKGDSRGISPRSGGDSSTNHSGDTQAPRVDFERTCDYSDVHGRGARLLVTAASQWLHATTGRIATCAHSWMQAVHWVGGSGLYTPSSSHSPKWGPTTVALAQEISALSECRPGVDYLARKLKVSERTVQYHLGMLREAGLLVYRSKGTRISGVGGRASVFERVIPVAFDEALGIRTTGEGVQRRPVGIAEEGRSLIGKLAKKAAGKTRRRSQKRSVSRVQRCTPMQGGTSASSSTGVTHSPSENKLASGEAKSPTQKKSNRGPRKLNKVGRRYQLAAELIAIVPWLHGASRARIAWIIRHVADAGWTALEVQAVAESAGPILPGDVRRASGMLAHRLKGTHLLYTTKDRRKSAVLAWQESRAAEHARHADWDQPTLAAPAVSKTAAEAMASIHATLQATVYGTSTAHAVEIPEDQPARRLEDLSKDQIVACRVEALRDHTVILDLLEEGAMTETDIRRLYTHRLVDQALALESIAARRTLAPTF